MEDLFFAVKLALQKLFKYYAKGTPQMGMLLISAQLIDPFRMLRLFRKWDKAMNNIPEDVPFYSTQCKEALLTYVENQCWAKHGCVPVNKPETVSSSNLIPSAMASGSGQSSVDPYDLSSDDEEYFTPNSVAERTPGWSGCATHLSTAARLYPNSPPEAPGNRGLINPNLNHSHSDPMEISRPSSILDISEWWHKPEETRSEYADISNVARNLFSIIPQVDGVESSFSLGLDVIGWRQSKTTGETVCKKVVLRHLVRANHGILAGDDPALDLTHKENDSEMKKEAEETRLHTMAKVHDFLEMWQGSQNLCATQNESQAENKQLTAVGYISDMEIIIQASWSLFLHDGAAAFKLSERSPLPTALSSKDLPGGRTQRSNVR